MTGQRVRAALASLLVIAALAIPALAHGQAGWPRQYEGSPGAIAGSLGYSIWHDGDGWHVRWSTAGRSREFSGVIGTDGRFTDIERIRLERRRDRLEVREARTEIDFVAHTRDNVEGFDFRTTGDRLTFDLRLDGRRIDPDLVRLGRRLISPDRMPFTIRREERDAFAVFLGPIAVLPRETTGYFIWRDRDVWRVRWTTQNAFAVFSGSVTTEGRITDLDRVGFDPFDEIAWAGNRITFRAFNIGAVEGFDFRAQGEVEFALFINGRAASRGQVFIGAGRVAPPWVPFVVVTGRGLERREREEARGWPAFTEGDPGRLARESRLGYYIWHDDEGWHVRWTTAGRDRAFSGTIRTNGEFRDVERVRLERPWDIVRRADREIAFRATASGGIDGFDFRTTGTVLTFDLLLDGQRIRPTLVFLGAVGAHPPAVPFTLAR